MPKNMSAEKPGLGSNPRVTKFRNLGLIRYKEAWDYQESLFQSIVEIKLQNQKLGEDKQIITPNYLLLCEHPHVYTLGKSGSEENLLINDLQLKARNAEFFAINRGGDITYHGPGQIVAYPILNLTYFVKGVREYIHKLEEAVIIMLKHYQIEGERLEGATGVWLDVGKRGQTRKICAIGVRTSRWVSMHGLALNINTDLNYFNLINPCGFTDKKVTSLEHELGFRVPYNEATDRLTEAIANVFEMDLCFG